MIEIHHDYRAALKAFMDKNGLNPKEWCDMAGLNSGVLYSYLKGRSKSITLDSLAKLAEAAGKQVHEVLGENNLIERVVHIPLFDDELLRQCIEDALIILHEEGLDEDPAVTAAGIVELFKGRLEIERQITDRKIAVSIGDKVVEFPARRRPG